MTRGLEVVVKEEYRLETILYAFMYKEKMEGISVAISDLQKCIIKYRFDLIGNRYLILYKL